MDGFQKPEDEPVLSPRCVLDIHDMCRDLLNCDCECHGCGECGG